MGKSDRRQESLDNLEKAGDACDKVLKDFYDQRNITYLVPPQEPPRKHLWDKSIKKELRDIGQEAIEESRDMIKRFGFNLCQLDWIINKGDKWCSVDVKHLTPMDDSFKISKRQVRDRLNLQSDKDIRAILLIKSRVNSVWYWQYMDILEQGNHWNDNDKPGSFIHYPLDSFRYII